MGEAVLQAAALGVVARRAVAHMDLEQEATQGKEAESAELVKVAAGVDGVNWAVAKVQEVEAQEAGIPAQRCATQQCLMIFLTLEASVSRSVLRCPSTEH
mmetsp:Transcript_22528/g.47706  ORF Transcript_22528/g.47706 Transcript_22528/m.47706 type:complete len:100 (-) Transcript_22528:198-497(-)